jgi:amino acid adenylation domain-containing protein
MLVQEFLETSATRFPEKTALIVGEERFSYAQIDNLANRLAVGLVENGLRPQDRVVTFLDNSLESVVSIFGVLKAGGIFVVLNPTMKAKKLLYILEDSGTRFLITHPSKLRIVREAIPGRGDLEHIIWCQAHKPPKGIGSATLLATVWDVFLSSGTTRKTNSAPVCIDIDLATIIYTSGSTGEPKGVMSTHLNMYAAARSIIQYLGNAPDDIIFTSLPLSFDYGLYQVLMAFLFGGTVVLERSFAYPYEAIDRLVSERATGFPIVPTMAAILLQMDNLARFDLGSLRYISNTAAALPVSYIRRFREMFPGVRIYSMYGLTECKRVAYLPPEEIDRKPESVGIPMPNTDVFIVNENGDRLGPGEAGELVVRGANVMQGYWKAPEETKKSFRQGRFPSETLLYTGDLFKRDVDGFLYFVARKDDLIKTKGERVSPKEIENMVCEMPEVVEAAAFGVPDDVIGQAIRLCVVGHQRSELTEKQIARHCFRNLEPFMVPKYIRIMKSLPRSGSGKVDKKRLAELHREEIQNGL